MTIDELYELADENNALKYRIAVPFGNGYYMISNYPVEVVFDGKRQIADWRRPRKL